jgi:hypothetical protein
VSGYVSIRLLRPWRHYAPGFVLRNVPAGQANLMVSRGLGAEVAEVKITPRPVTPRRAGGPK